MSVCKRTFKSIRVSRAPTSQFQTQPPLHRFCRIWRSVRGDRFRFCTWSGLVYRSGYHLRRGGEILQFRVRYYSNGRGDIVSGSGRIQGTELSRVLSDLFYSCTDKPLPFTKVDFYPLLNATQVKITGPACH